MDKRASRTIGRFPFSKKNKMKACVHPILSYSIVWMRQAESTKTSMDARAIMQDHKNWLICSTA